MLDLTAIWNILEEVYECGISAVLGVWLLGELASTSLPPWQS